jgi:hypothetical protein
MSPESAELFAGRHLGPFKARNFEHFGPTNKDIFSG